MKQKDVIKKINEINTKIKVLLQETTPGKYGDIDENIEYDDDPDTNLRGQIYSLLENLESIQYEIDYINKEVKAEGYLYKNNNDRYSLGESEFTCGDPIELLVEDCDIKMWVRTRIEYDNIKHDYYAVGYKHIELNNVKVRVRE